MFYWWEDYVLDNEAEAFVAQSSVVSTVLITLVLLPLAAAIDRFESSCVFAVLGVMHSTLLLLLPVLRVKYFAWCFAITGGGIFQLQSVVLNKFFVDYLLHNTHRLAYDVTAFNTLGSAVASLIALGCGTLPKLGGITDVVKSGNRRQYAMSGYQSWSMAAGTLAVLAPVLWYMSARVARTVTEKIMPHAAVDKAESGQCCSQSRDAWAQNELVLPNHRGTGVPQCFDKSTADNNVEHINPCSETELQISRQLRLHRMIAKRRASLLVLKEASRLHQLRQGKADQTSSSHTFTRLLDCIEHPSEMADTLLSADLVSRYCPRCSGSASKSARFFRVDSSALTSSRSGRTFQVPVSRTSMA